jgi:hypothetical protein
MSTNHNRIKVADLEVNQPDKILTTNSNGELDFTDIKNIKAESYNGLDYTLEGKALDARQGKALKDSLDNLNSNLNEKENTSNKVQDIEINKNSSTAFPSIKSIYDWSKGLFKTWILSIENFSSTAYTLNAENINKRTVFSSSSPVTITIPNDSAISLPIGTKKEFTQKGTGKVTIGGSGVFFTTNSPLTMSIGETRVLTKIGINEWTIEGNKNDISQLTDTNSLLVNKVPNTIFVNDVTGNDTNAEFENPKKPFATIQKALEFQSSIEGYSPFGVKIVITNSGSYSMGNKMLTNQPNSDINILLFNLNITGLNGTPTLVFTNGADIGTTTLDNVNIIHKQLINSPLSGGIKLNSGSSNSIININTLKLSDITAGGNVFKPEGLFYSFKINSITIDNTCTNSQLDLSSISTLSFAKILSITNNANSFSPSSANSIFAPPFQDFEFGSIVNNATSSINLWGDWTATAATITIGNISSPNALMRIPLGIHSGDYGLNTKLKLYFKNSLITNCWISGNTVNSQCYVSGKATFNYSLDTPFFVVSRTRLNTDFSNKDTCTLKDLELNINYNGNYTNPLIFIPNYIYNGSPGMADAESQMILENVKISTNVPIEIFRIPTNSKLDTPRLIVFRGINAFHNSKELINIGITPTNSKFITSQKAVIYHSYNILSNNSSLFINQEQSY